MSCEFIFRGNKLQFDLDCWWNVLFICTQYIENKEPFSNQINLFSNYISVCDTTFLATKHFSLHKSEITNLNGSSGMIQFCIMKNISAGQSVYCPWWSYRPDPKKTCEGIKAKLRKENPSETLRCWLVYKVNVMLETTDFLWIPSKRWSGGLKQAGCVYSSRGVFFSDIR